MNSHCWLVSSIHLPLRAVIGGESHLRQERQNADQCKTGFVQHEDLLRLGALHHWPIRFLAVSLIRSSSADRNA
jgi:hypothetical protein